MNSIPAGWMGLDIGPKTLSDIQAGLADCKTGERIAPATLTTLIYASVSIDFSSDSPQPFLLKTCTMQ